MSTSDEPSLPPADLDELVARLRAAELALKAARAALATIDATRREAISTVAQKARERDRLLHELAEPTPLPLFASANAERGTRNEEMPIPSAVPRSPFPLPRCSESRPYSALARALDASRARRTPNEPAADAALRWALAHLAPSETMADWLEAGTASHDDLQAALRTWPNYEYVPGVEVPAGAEPWAIIGGLRPRFWCGAKACADWPKGLPTLHGQALVAAVRKLLALSTPADARRAKRQHRLHRALERDGRQAQRSFESRAVVEAQP